MAVAPDSDLRHYHAITSSSQASVVPPPTPQPAAAPTPGFQPGPDASQASSANEHSVPGPHTSISGQAQVDRDSEETSETSNGASSQQLQGDSPKARWSQVSGHCGKEVSIACWQAKRSCILMYAASLA